MTIENMAENEAVSIAKLSIGIYTLIGMKEDGDMVTLQVVKSH